MKRKLGTASRFLELGSTDKVSNLLVVFDTEHENLCKLRPETWLV